MAERKMGPKGFLHKANGKVSADAFLKAHREWLTSGDLALFTTPILNKIETGELLPTPGLEEIKAVVLSHHLAEEVRKAEAAMTRADNQPRTRKNYLGTIHDSHGTELIKKSFDTPQDCEGWLDRRLFEGESDCYGVATAMHLFNQDGEHLSTVICRQDSIARILKKPKSPFMKTQGAKSATLSNRMKVRGDHFNFSRG